MIKYFFVFLTFSALLAYHSWQTPHIALRIVCGNAALSFIVLAWGYLCYKPQIFMKKSNGNWSILSFILHWPYLLVSSLGLLAIALLGRENCCDKISDNLYLGRRIFPHDLSQIKDLEIKNVLDLTGEFPENSWLRKNCNCLCLPILDTTPPTPQQLEQGLTWLQEYVVQDNTYVHCAMGHGRSAVFVVAYCMIKYSLSLDEAIQMVQEKRPGVRLRASQYQMLARSSQNLSKTN